MSGKCGATGVFVGTLRDFNDGQVVKGLTLEHYPGMTEKHLEKVCEDAGTRWQLLDTLVIHRHGPIHTGDPIVLVATWAAHRRDALEACRYIIDELKTRAPFWKKETLADNGMRWVDPGS